MLKLNGTLGVEDFYKVIFENNPIEIDSTVFETIENSFNF